MLKQTLEISKTELKRRMTAAKLKAPAVADKMIKRGWGWYPNKLYRLLRREGICLHRAEMNDLLGILREGAEK